MENILCRNLTVQNPESARMLFVLGGVVALLPSHAFIADIPRARPSAAVTPRARSRMALESFVVSNEFVESFGLDAGSPVVGAALVCVAGCGLWRSNLLVCPSLSVAHY